MENNSQFEDHEKTKLDKRRIEELRDLEELTPSYGQLLKALDELSEEKLFTNGIFEACQKRGYNGRNDDYTALKKFIVEKAIINGIVNEDEKDSFGRSINNWIKERFRPDKDNIFKLCFALEMDELETREFILKKCLKRPFNYRRIEETIFYYCIMNGYNYAHAMKLKDILKSVISDIENCQNETLYTQQFSDGLWNINSDDEFIEYCKMNKLYFHQSNITVQEKIIELMDRIVCNTSGNVDALNSVEAFKRVITDILKDIYGDSYCLMPPKKKNAITELQYTIPQLKNIPRKIRENLPINEHVSRVVQGTASQEVYRKTLVLFHFYDFFEEAKYKNDKYDEYLFEINTILFDCGYEQLYYRNPYDWVFAYCATQDDPIEIFQNILAAYAD